MIHILIIYIYIYFKGYFIYYYYYYISTKIVMFTENITRKLRVQVNFVVHNSEVFII